MMKRLLILTLASIALAGCSNDTEIDASCRADLQCYAQAFKEQAEMLCKARIEQTAKSDLVWERSRELELISSYQWKDKARGTLAYFGHKARIKTPSGEYATEKYECDIDPNKKPVQLIGVKVSIQ